MSWIVATLVSAGLLGVYDLAKKTAAVGNAVPPLLLMSTATGAAIWLVMLAGQSLAGAWFATGGDWFDLPPIGPVDHLRLAGKAVLVGASWTANLLALRRLPLSIAAPIRCTSPVGTVLIATVALGERPAPTQWFGVGVVLIGFIGLSTVGRREGWRLAGADRSIAWMLLATALAALSSVYDKILLQQFGYSPATVQLWFTLYLVPVMVPAAFFWWRAGGGGKTPGDGGFQFRWSILAIAPLLLAADWVYFAALSDPEALVTVVSALRRASVVVSLIGSGVLLAEKRIAAKLGWTMVLVGGIVMLLVAG